MEVNGRNSEEYKKNMGWRRGEKKTSVNAVRLFQCGAAAQAGGFI